MGKILTKPENDEFSDLTMNDFYRLAKLSDCGNIEIIVGNAINECNRLIDWLNAKITADDPCLMVCKDNVSTVWMTVSQLADRLSYQGIDSVYKLTISSVLMILDDFEQSLTSSNNDVSVLKSCRFCVEQLLAVKQ